MVQAKNGKPLKILEDIEAALRYASGPLVIRHLRDRQAAAAKKVARLEHAGIRAFDVHVSFEAEKTVADAETCTPTRSPAQAQT